MLECSDLWNLQPQAQLQIGHYHERHYVSTGVVVPGQADKMIPTPLQSAQLEALGALQIPNTKSPGGEARPVPQSLPEIPLNQTHMPEPDFDGARSEPMLSSRMNPLMMVQEHAHRLRTPSMSAEGRRFSLEVSRWGAAGEEHVCAVCGKALEVAAKFCTGCGKPVSQGGSVLGSIAPLSHQQPAQPAGLPSVPPGWGGAPPPPPPEPIVQHESAKGNKKSINLSM